MNELCPDIGYKSTTDHGKLPCGAHADIIEQDEGSLTLVFAHGIESHMYANILSIVRSKFVSASPTANLPLEEYLTSIAAFLPDYPDGGTANHILTIIRLIDNKTAEIIQFDSPKIILIRNAADCEFLNHEMNISGRRIYRAFIPLLENDIFICVSSTGSHAYNNATRSFCQDREVIVSSMEKLAREGHCAKNLSAILEDKCHRLCCSTSGSVTAACVVRMRKRMPVNLMFGPPASPEDNLRMISAFFAREGKHIVCGGTTATIVSRYLEKPLRTILHFESADVPPIAEIEGVDLVTEGIITVSKVLAYAKDHLSENGLFEEWTLKKDGAAMICRLLFEEATDINFFIGKAVNPAHQNPELPINFNIKMNLVQELSECLRKMGKRINVRYF